MTKKYILGTDLTTATAVRMAPLQGRNPRESE